MAKDACHCVVSLYKGSASIQHSNYEVVQDEADEFAMKEDEEPRELFRRVTKLAVSLRDHVSKDTDDNWIKRKFLKAMMPYHKALSPVIRQRPDFHSLTSNEVLDEFVAMRILDKTADNTVLCSQRAKMPNLALKAKVIVEEEEEEESNPEDTKYDYHEHMALASRQFWSKKNTRPNFNKNNSSGFKGKQRVRTCYNCGNASHFVVDCPYEKWEDNGGKLIRKDKAKSFPNKNNFTKKTPTQGLVVQEEYHEDDDDDEDSEAMAMASVAIGTTPRVSLFDSTNENITAKCLMAKATNKLKGKSKKHFVALLEQLGEANDMIKAHEETISKMEGHSCDYADEIWDLSKALEEERGHRLALEESHNDDHAKLKKDLDHAIVVSRVLTSEKAKLGVDHARLKEEFAILDKAHKVLKGAHAGLKESHDQLQVKLTKEKATFPHMVLIDNANATKLCCEHVHLVEENAKLKEQLEKGLVTCIQGERNLNDILSNQKEVVAKEGVGFAPKSKNKKKNDKAKRPPPLKQTFVKEGEGAPKEKKNNVKGGDVKKGNATPSNKAGDFNPSYVLCRASDGHVYAKFVGSLYEYIECGATNHMTGSKDLVVDVHKIPSMPTNVEWGDASSSKEMDNAPLKWSHHQRKTHTLPKNKVKALNLMNKTKGKINLKMVVNHQMMPKVKFSPSSKFKIKSKLKIKNKLKTALKMIKKLPLLLSHPRRN
ncbi:unnamed protein product [Triticum aestivum]|uniref:CCHC-type domain-containing protein n=1 Tax=Triticum aestivum TaxID=4565 RepID=A0A7H4LR36_WHEAT|nr:unnamed protein product [Triticum aestivum]